MTVTHPGRTAIRDAWHSTAEAIQRLPGANERDKSWAVSAALIDHIEHTGGENWFYLEVDADDSRITYGERGEAIIGDGLPYRGGLRFTNEM